MKRLLVFVCLLVALVATPSCTDPARQIQIHTADSIAEGANTALPILIQRYRAEGDKVIAKAETRKEAEAGIAKVKEKWEPRWQAWEALRIAQDAWATTLEKGGDLNAALGSVRQAYCGLRAVWPEEIPAIPLVPVKCEEKAK